MQHTQEPYYLKNNLYGLYCLVQMARDLCCVKAVKQCSKNCQELWFLHFFVFLHHILSNFSTHYVEANGSSLRQSQVQSRADSPSPELTPVCKHPGSGADLARASLGRRRSGVE